MLTLPAICGFITAGRQDADCYKKSKHGSLLFFFPIKQGGAVGGAGLTERCKKREVFFFLNSGDSPNRRRRFSSVGLATLCLK
jgi:hypothetical protein